MALHRQIVAIADLTLSPNEAQRGYVRINAAFAFANARQFDEAERLANEAVAVGERMRPPQTKSFAPQADQIRRMKAAAESGSARTEGRGNGGGVTSSHWFTYRAPDGTPKSGASPAEKEAARTTGPQ